MEDAIMKNLLVLSLLLGFSVSSFAITQHSDAEENCKLTYEEPVSKNVAKKDGEAEKPKSVIFTFSSLSIKIYN